MEKDYLTLDTTLSMDDAIARTENITPDDDPRFDPILPSQQTARQKIPNKRTVTMDEALETYRLKMDSYDMLTKIANGDIITHFWGNAAKGVGDFVAQAKLMPTEFNGAVFRAFNGHVFPDMTEDEAVRLMDSTTSYVANQENLRNLIIQSQGGADSVGRKLGSGAAQVISFGVVGLMTGGVGIGAMTGAQEFADISQEMAEKAMAENGGTLRGYDNRGDAIYSALHGVVSGWIETRLGVENLFTSSAKKHIASRLGAQILKSGVSEGAEEFLQEGSKYLFENMAGRNDRTFGEFMKDAVTNAVYGAILGGTFGGLMYPVNKLRVEKALKAQGLSDVEAKAVAGDMINTAKNSILQEVDTRSQLRDHYGEQWTGLKNKIVTALENAGWRETNPDIDLEKYAADNADDIVRPLFNMSNKFGIDTRDLIQLSDIDVIDNAIYLKPMNLGSPEVISSNISKKKEQVKRLNMLARTGAGDPETKRALNTQIELLQKYYEKLTGDRFNAARRVRAGKAKMDAEILATTAPAVSETIAAIDTTQMSSGEPTTQIREKLDGQPFVYVGDKQLPVEYKVVPMDEVIASHIGQDINTRYSLKELQNRAQRGSRTDVSILQSRAAKIQPENLGIAYNTQNGAPVINDKGEVIAGNGRYEVLRMTDEKGRARYNKYLESLGLDLTGIKDPILVRVMHNLTPEQQIAVADASNVSATSAFDNASQAAQDAKLLKGTTGVTDFLNKIPIESRQGLFLANDRVNKVALDRRYNDALMMWLLNGDTALYEELYLMGGITQKIQSALNQSIPGLMSLENQYPDVGIRKDLANALKRYPQVARSQDFALTVSQVEIDDGRPDLFNENVLLYALNFGKNTKTWEGTGTDRLQVGLTLSEFFDTYTRKATTNQENIGQVDMFGQPLAVEQSRGDLLAETLTLAFPREFQDGAAVSRDMKAVFLTRAQTAPTQLNQMDLLDTVQPSLFADDTSTASAVRNLPWERPVNVSNPTFFNRMPDANDIEIARNNGIDSFLILDKNEVPSKLVLLDGSVIGLKPGAKIPSGKDLYKPNQLFQEQLDLANENARLDDIYPAYEGETITINGKDRSVYNSNGERIAKSAEALRNFYKWFGDSKMVDEQGRPLVVYHGSKSVFDTFDNTVNQTKERQMGANLGYFFTDSEYVANKFRTKEQQLEEAGYYIENTVREPITEEKYDAQGRYLGSVHYTKATLPPYKNFGLYKVYLKAENIVEYQGESLGVWDVRESALKSAKASGKDGMIIYKADTGGGIANEYIVFEPNQIKSTDNRGTYDSRTPNIYYQSELSAAMNQRKKAAEDRNIIVDKLKNIKNQPMLQNTQTGEILIPTGIGNIRIVDKSALEDQSVVFGYEPETRSFIVPIPRIQSKTIKQIQNYVEKQDLETAMFHEDIHRLDHKGESDIDIKSEFMKELNPDVSMKEYFNRPEEAHAYAQQRAAQIAANISQMSTTERLNVVGNAEFIDRMTDRVSKYYEWNTANTNYFRGLMEDLKSYILNNLTDDVYYQGRKVNGFYDPELEVIVLGRNSNTGTLPHEMSHYWANTIFNLVKSGKYNNNPDFMAQAMGMFRMLGVGMNQDTLTRDQQEMFASMTEAVIFGMAPIPQGTELPMTAFLNWVPQKYKSILDIGYRNSEGRIVNPILDKQAVEWFNAWYANGTLPSIDASPLMMENSNGEQDGRIIPSSTEVMKVRATEMTTESDNLKRARTEQMTEVIDSTPASERAAAAGAEVKIESQPGNIERSEPPAEKKRGIMSYLIPGRGTNTREGMFAAARDYISKERAHAEEIAFGSPATVPNDTGVDRAILIRALMEEYKQGDPEYAELYHNLAETVSLAGKTPGLSNDMNFQFYNEAVRRITDGMEGVAAIKYAGTRNLNKARRTFNSDIDAFIQEHAAKILNTAPDTERREMLIKQMLAEASVKFAGDNATQLNQEDLRRGRSIKSADRAVFIEWANREVRKMLKATPDTDIINRTMELSEKAEKARKYLDSNDNAEVQAAGKTIREWQLFVAEKEVPETWYSKLIGSWYPKAMLYNINTHLVNMTGNTFNYGIVHAAVAAQYKQGNKVSKQSLDAEKERLYRLYDTSLMNLAAMESPTSPTLLHGEQYNPREGKSTIGKVADFSMDLLGKEDAIFRIRAYLDALGHIATADAVKTGGSPTELFNEYKKINNPKGTRAYEARLEALRISDIAVFQQTGVLSSALKKVRDALNMGQRGGLGTLLGPFVKTPANIVEQGARAILAPITSTYHGLTGKWTIQDSLDTGYFALACILTMGLMADYEPPYEVPQRYDPNKPYDSIRIRGTDKWIKLDTFGPASVPLRIIASIATGKGLGIAGAFDEIPLIGDLSDAYSEAARIEKDPYKQGVRFGANWAYNRVNTAVPAIIKYTLAAMHPADLNLDELDLGLPKTGIGRKIGRQYGLDGGDTTTNDILRIFFNRLKIYKE